jgi:hypothetical protein
MKKVFVIISDNNYLEHSKSLFNSIKEIGEWDGDLCLIANNVNDELLEDFNKFGVEIVKKNIDNFYYANFFIFDTFFKKWDFIFYMDCDFTIFKNVNEIFSEDEMKSKCLYADIEPFKIYDYLCQGYKKNEKDKKLSSLSNQYDLNRYGFNAGFLGFNTSLINENTLKDLINLKDNIQEVNNHCTIGSDQPVFNLYFINDFKPIENKKISFWRGSDNNTIAQHHCHGEAPWVNNTFSDKLNKTYAENYTHNLNLFYEKIKK